MAASPKVYDRARLGKSESAHPEQEPSATTQSPTLRAARHGVVCLWGYGVKVFVRNGHLQLQDGVGRDRHEWRFARVGSGLKRLVVLTDSGFITLDALRWIYDRGAALLMLDRAGTVIASTGPEYGLDDARLRRAQALALQSGVGLQIARELIDRKVAGQERVARERLKDSTTADTIAKLRKALPEARTFEAVSLIESHAARHYWASWEGMPIPFVRSDLPRVPAHWLSFGSRKSLLSGSQRLASDPLNAILNYLSALVESEARLAVAAVGLDSGLGFIHFDTKGRASLANDIQEPVRAMAEDYVLGLISRFALKREWFQERTDGNCRLMAPFAARLSETAPMWRQAVSPISEWIAQKLWSTMKKGKNEPEPATRLTQQRKREAKGAAPLPAPVRTPVLENSCRECGAPIQPGSRHCYACSNLLSGAKERFIKSLPKAHVVTLGAAAQRLRAESQRRHYAELRKWKRSNQRITEEIYTKSIQPRLADVSYGAIAEILGVCPAYARDIQRGKRRPHARHWPRLGELVGFTGP